MVQCPKDANEALRKELIILAGLEQQESFIVLGYLLQFLTAYSSPIEDSIDEFLYLLRLLDEQLQREVVEQRGKVFRFFNKEQKQSKHPTFEGQHTFFGGMRVCLFLGDASHCLCVFEEGESLIDVLHTGYLFIYKECSVSEWISRDQAAHSCW